MKIVKIMALLLIGMAGLPSVLHAESAASDVASTSNTRTTIQKYTDSLNKWTALATASISSPTTDASSLIGNNSSNNAYSVFWIYWDRNATKNTVATFVEPNGQYDDTSASGIQALLNIIIEYLYSSPSPTPTSADLTLLGNAINLTFQQAIYLASTADRITLLKQIIQQFTGTQIATNQVNFNNEYMATIANASGVFATVRTAIAAKQDIFIDIPAKVSALTNATTFATLVTALNNANSYTPTSPITSLTTLGTAVVTALSKIIALISTQDNYSTVKTILETAVSKFPSISFTAVATALAAKDPEHFAAEATLIANLKSANTLDIIYSYLDAALANSYTAIDSAALGSAVATALTNAIEFITATNYSTVRIKLTSYITAATSKFQSTNFTSISTTLTTKVSSIFEDVLISSLKSATTLDVIYSLFNAAFSYTPIDSAALGSAVATALIKAIDFITSSNYSTIQPKLSSYITTAASKFSNSNFTSISAALTSKIASLPSAANEATLISNLNSATTLDTIYSYLDTVLANSYTPINSSTLGSAVIVAISNAIDFMTFYNYLTVQPKLTSYITAATSKFPNQASILSSISTAVTTKVTSITSFLNEETLISNLKYAAQAATPLDNLYSYLGYALAPSYTPANASSVGAAIATALTYAITLITSSNYSTVQPKLAAYITTATSKYTGTNFSSISTALTNKQQQLQAAAQETKLIVDLRTATTFAALLSLLTTALASTYTPVNATELTSTVAAAFTAAINAAASLDNITQLSNLLKAPPTYFTSNVTTLTQTLTTKQQQLKAASDAAAAATAEQQLIANLKTATTFAALLPLLTTALASTYTTPINATNFVSAVASAFTTAINTAASLDNIIQLSNLLKAHPTYFTSNVAMLTSAITQKQQQLKAASDAAAAAAAATTAEQQLIANLKAATTFAALLPLLTTALASTYTPVNATELASTVAAAFTVAINAAASLDNITQLSNLLKAPPTYFTSNVTTLTSAIAQKQQQLKSASDAAAAAAAATTAEQQLIANLKAATTFAAIKNIINDILAYSPSSTNLTALGTTLLTAFNKAVTLVQPTDYQDLKTLITSTAAQSKYGQDFAAPLQIINNKINPGSNTNTLKLATSNKNFDQIVAALDPVVGTSTTDATLKKNLKTEVLAALKAALGLVTTSAQASTLARIIATAKKNTAISAADLTKISTEVGYVTQFYNSSINFDKLNSAILKALQKTPVTTNFANHVYKALGKLITLIPSAVVKSPATTRTASTANKQAAAARAKALKSIKSTFAAARSASFMTSFKANINTLSTQLPRN
jgi:uncharacterized protein YgfB (UPF0149 family)